MEVSRIRINGSLKTDLMEHLKREIHFTYRGEYGVTTILAGEEFRLRIDSTQAYFIVLFSTETYLFIDIVCAGGGGGFLQIAWGSENAFVKRVEKCIAEFCAQRNEILEKVE